MLEVLLMAYKDQMGEDFPLKSCEGMAEIDVINILYYCVQQNILYEEGMAVVARIDEAPGFQPK